MILDVTPAAAMLGALSADWGVERTVMKDKASILPLVIIAKAQVDWPTSIGNIKLGYGYNGTELLTPPSSSTNIAGVANLGPAHLILL